MKEILVRKGRGTLVPYDESKVRASIEKTGASKEAIEKVLSYVRVNLKNGMKTAEIYRMVREQLRHDVPWAAARYSLREAIFKLGPAGFNFEKYVAAVLSAYGYKTQTPESYTGACIEHEVDVTAEKDGRTAFIEAKFRHDFSTAINIKDVLATWARFLDLVDGSNIDLCPHFDEVWIVTNAVFTDQSLAFGHCKNMKLIGWNHPKERTFANMVDLDALYPITVIQDLSAAELEAFAKAGFILCRDICQLVPQDLKNVTGLSVKRLSEIVKSCDKVVFGPKEKDEPEVDTDD